MPSTAGAGVTLEFNNISVFSNPIRGNSIYGNGTANGVGSLSTLGIDLGGGGLTLNDELDDGDNGPNFYQNFPLIDLGGLRRSSRAAPRSRAA